MRASWLTAIVIALGVATSVHTTSFFVRAEACWFLRMPASKRPACCGLSNKTRFTPEGGDCCKHLVLDESTSAITSVTLADVVAVTPRVAVAVDLALLPMRRDATRPPPAARGPPPRPFHPTATTVLRV